MCDCLTLKEQFRGNFFFWASLCFKGNAQFVQKWPLDLLRISDKTIIKVGNVTKAANFKSFLHLSYKNTELLFLWQCFLILSWDKHKNMNCAFPLRYYATFKSEKNWVAFLQNCYIFAKYYHLHWVTSIANILCKYIIYIFFQFCAWLLWFLFYVISKSSSFLW